MAAAAIHQPAGKTKGSSKCQLPALPDPGTVLGLSSLSTAWG